MKTVLAEHRRREAACMIDRKEGRAINVMLEP